MVFPGLEVVVVNWNLKKDTLECIDSLLKSGVEVNQITLVDNGSNDDSVNAIIDQFGKDLHLISNTQNLGFAGGVNVGVRAALQANSEWILLINNDTIAAPDFISHLRNAATNPPFYKIIGAAIYYFNHPDRLWYLANRAMWGTLITTNPYRGKPLPTRMPEIIPADFLNGCAMLVHRGVFETIGLFDEALFMYAEEVDFCLRARTAGVALGCATHASIWHKVSSSANRDKPNSRYMRIRNQIWVYRRYAGGLQRILLFFYTGLRSTSMALSDLAAKQPNLLKPMVSGWINGWFGSIPTRRHYRNG